MKAPVKGGNSNRLENVPLIEAGFQLCTLYGLVDLGTQETKFGPKHKVMLMFEFPQQMRKYYEDRDPQPAAIYSEENLSLHEKANLRKKFVQPMHGSAMTDAEAEEFDLTTLLGKSFVANMVHTPDGKYANMNSLSQLTEQNKGMYGLDSTTVAQVNKQVFFSLDQGFESLNYGNLPNFLKSKLEASEEGKAHKLAGGKFAEYVKDEQQGTSASTNAPSAPSQSKIQMIDPTHNYDDFIAQGWTDQQLIDNGYAKMVQPTPPPTPQSVATPPVPGVPPTPAAPPVPKKEPVLVMTNPNQTVEAFLEIGWTKEQIVEQGHGRWE